MTLITEPQKIMEFLESWTKYRPHMYLSRLEKGSIVQKGSDLFYEIDNPEIYERLNVRIDSGQIPHSVIYNKFKRSPGYRNGRMEVELEKLFNDEGVKKDGKTYLPFSKVFENGYGECVETAILTQLFAQRGRDSFLTTGVFGQDDEVGVMHHTFNVIFKDGKPYIADITNPYNQDPSRPYIVPIEGVDDSEYREFKIEEKYRNGRQYSLI